jgi:hypothetical protein
MFGTLGRNIDEPGMLIDLRGGTATVWIGVCVDDRADPRGDVRRSNRLPERADSIGVKLAVGASATADRVAIKKATTRTPKPHDDVQRRIEEFLVVKSQFRNLTVRVAALIPFRQDVRQDLSGFRTIWRDL